MALYSRSYGRRSRGTWVSACPLCGDDVNWYRSRRSRGRYVRCVNPDCAFSGPLPRRGTIHVTTVTCPTHAGVVVGISTNATDNPADARRYFWQAGDSARPCDQCREHATCAALTEAAGMLDEPAWLAAAGRAPA